MAPRLLLIAPVVLLAALAACGQSEQVTPSPSQGETAGTPTASATATEETPAPAADQDPVWSPPAGWKTYTDAAYGFTFRYPPDWHLSVSDRVSGSFFILTSYDPETAKRIGGGIPDDKLKVTSYVADDVYQPLEQWLEESVNRPGAPPPPDILSSIEIEFGGKRGLRQLTEFQGQRDVAYYLNLGDGRVFVISAAPADSKFWGDFESILASLDFSATARK